MEFEFLYSSSASRRGPAFVAKAITAGRLRAKFGFRISRFNAAVLPNRSWVIFRLALVGRLHAEEYFTKENHSQLLSFHS
jgi:hypothetical protein